MANELDGWDAATEGPEGTRYRSLKGEGTDGENAYLVSWADGTVSRAYCNPAKGGIEQLISEILHPPEPPARSVILPYGAFRARWTDDELAELFSARKTVWQIDDYIGLAQAQGHVNLTGVDDPETESIARAAKALFVALGVLTEARADAIFAVPS